MSSRSPCSGAPGAPPCGAPSVLRRPKDGSRLCRASFMASLEDEVLATIRRHSLFALGERVAL
jgi:hypothetical protein